jgi:siroheme synthase
MGRGTAAELAVRLIARGLDSATPVAIAENVSTETERVQHTDLAALAAGGAGEGHDPVVILIGAAIGATVSAPAEVSADS